MLSALIQKAITAVAPHADAADWAAALVAPMQSAGIVTEARIAMFLGQCSVESRGFESLEEDLYYLDAQRIVDVFGRGHFATLGEASPYIGRPEDLANYVYSNRNGNGPTSSGDGWWFRGRGLIQISGRANYQMLQNADPRAADPKWLATKPGAAISACWFWSRALPGQPALNALSDEYNIQAVTKRINGAAMEGLEVREQAVDTIYAACRVVTTIPADPTDALNAAELARVGGDENGV